MVSSIFLILPVPPLILKNLRRLHVKTKDGMELEPDSAGEETVYSSGNSREQINIPGRRGKFQTGETIHIKYSNRPVKLEDACLAQFFTSYVSCQRPGKNIKFDDGCSTT